MEYVDVVFRILSKMYFEDEIQFKCGRCVTSCFEKVSYFGIADNKWIE